MTTRHAKDGSPLHQNRYASDEAFVKMRGVEGMAVLRKAMMLTDPRGRELLFALAKFSIEDRGCGRISRDLLELNPERIGTQEMRELEIRPDKRYGMDIADEVEARVSVERWRYFRDPDLGSPDSD